MSESQNCTRSISKTESHSFRRRKLYSVTVKAEERWQLRSFFCFLTQVEKRRLPWLIGTMVAVILVFQYFELPYEDVLSSLFSAGKGSFVGENRTQAAYSQFEFSVSNNVTSSTDMNAPFSQDIDGTSNNEGGGDDDFQSEINRGLNKSLLDEDDDYEASPPWNSVESSKNSTMDDLESSSEDVGGKNQRLFQNKDSSHNASIEIRTENNTKILEKESENNQRSYAGLASPSPAGQPMYASENTISPTASAESNAFSKEKDEITPHNKSEQSPSDFILSANTSAVDKGSKVPPPPTGIYTISEMKNLFIKNRASSNPTVPLWSSAVDLELLRAKTQIEQATAIDNDPNLHPPLFRNFSMFRRSYELMEDNLKVYIYREGEKPIFHQGPIQGIYASEGWFMRLLEANKKFVTKNPKKAHLFYIPFSSRMLQDRLYVPGSHSHKNLLKFLKIYLDSIVVKYPFWNRTGGADHFVVACHDWAPSETRKLMAKCIRALCNSDVREGFVFGKDVSLPETFVRLPRNPLRDIGGNSASQRPILAFFAGSDHGYLRPILLGRWQNKDPDMKIYGPLPKGKGKKNYGWHMKNSKYCICAKGYEVNSPRVVEAIFFECVPVIISDNFVPPFLEILNWESFAVFVMEKDIPDLKKILLSISDQRYREMQMMVKKVQQHFLWHSRPVKYDVFHMILHSVWVNRLYQIRPRLIE